MSFSRIRLVSYRNLEDAEINTAADRVFLIGENGQGKTNLLEALYYLSFGGSFRGQVDSQIPANGAKGFGLKGYWNNNSILEDEIEVSVQNSVKDIHLNGKPVRDRKELVGHNPSVVFCHEDFSFAAGEPELRRFFFDQCAGMISLDYIDILRAYRRVLKQRNAALKESAYDLLEVLDPQFVRYGRELMAIREIIFSRFQQQFPQLYEHVSQLGKPVELEYKPNWPQGAGFEEILQFVESKRDIEIIQGTTRSGPHRDRWNFVCGGESFTDTASTGQLRLVSLVLRVVEAIVYAETAAVQTGTRQWPVLLLDDVLLELDVGKRRRFLELLPGEHEGAQAFFTFLPGEPWTEYTSGDTLVYRVNHGRFEG